MTLDSELEFLEAEAHLHKATSEGLGRCRYCDHYHLGHHLQKCDIETSVYRARMLLGQELFDKGILMDEIEALTMERFPCNEYRAIMNEAN